MENSSGELEVENVNDQNYQCKEEKMAIVHETRSHNINKTNQLEDKCLDGPNFSPSIPLISSKDNIRDDNNVNARKSTKRSRKINSANSEQETTNGGIEVRPKKRQWESWGVDDKRIFFEALNEYGKDFDKIQSYIATKYRRRGDPSDWIKNKDQVRHFYYRTWNKISKYLDRNKDIYINGKKINQELCGLICYGELRKKIKGTAEKEVRKLNELITKGDDHDTNCLCIYSSSTCVRYQGRNVKIKAPYNQAMKVLTKGDGHTNHSDSAIKYPHKMPKKLIVELEPASNFSWTVVQTISQNPRLRVVLPSRKSMASLIEYLQRKWKRHEDFHETSSTSLDLSILAVRNLNSVNAGNDQCSAVSQCKSNGNYKMDDQKNESLDGDQHLMLDTPNEDNNEDKLSSDIVQASSKDGTMQSNNKQSITENTSYQSEKESMTQWNLSNCDGISIGDIYLQLGRPEKLQMKYVWTENRKDSDGTSSGSNGFSLALKRLAELADAEFTFIKQNNSNSNNRGVNGSTSNMVKELENCKNTTRPTSNPVCNPNKRVHIVAESQEKRPLTSPTTAIVTQANTVTTIALPKGRKYKNVTKGRPIVPHRRIILPRISNPPPGAVAVSVFPDMSLSNLHHTVENGQKDTEPLQLQTISIPANLSVSSGSVIPTPTASKNDELSSNQIATFNSPSSVTPPSVHGDPVFEDSTCNNMEVVVKSSENGQTSSILDMAVDKAFSKALKSSLDSRINADISDRLSGEEECIEESTVDTCGETEDLNTDSTTAVGDWISSEAFDISLGDLIGTEGNDGSECSESKIVDSHQSINQIKDTHSAMESILNEDSVDYVKKFATMASQMFGRKEEINSTALNFKSVI
ncbi:Protein cramped-like [Trichoplax sp. H2]|nr:Protein cramped-like [Trichoplax sp. H2]|eukprot:RDD38241.1 Protein cramped-like [Trichoplax sp. H2]